MPHHTRIILSFLLIFCLFPHGISNADTPLEIENIVNIVGLAMHGAPKHSAADTQYAYANPGAPKGGKIKMDAIGTFDTLNPYSLKGKAPIGMNLVYDRLMSRNWDEAFTMYPLIAESYELPEDRSSITFHLNPKARFHDGSPITADDVLFSFETLKTEGRPNMRKVYRLVSKAEKRGDRAVHFEFAQGHDRETALIIAMMPVLSKTYWENRTFDSTTLEIPLLNGAYRIKSFDVGKSITYQRNPDYWAADLLANKGHNNFDEITYDFYRDDTVAFEAFTSGNLDLRREANLRKWNTAYNFPRIQSGEIIKQDLQHGRPEKTTAFIFNTRKELFSDIRTREALTLLLDRRQINKILFNNTQKFITSYFPNSEFESIAHRSPPENQPFDLRANLRRASALLKEAGWNVADGVQMKDGKPFSFELLLQHPEEEKIALNFKQNLKRLGIHMNIRVADSAGFIRRLQTYDYDMVLHFWQTSLSPGTEQILYWGCEAAKQEGRFNYAGICTPEIDRLSAAVAFTKTREELVSTMRALDAELLKGNYIAPLFYSGADYVAFKKNIKHPEATPLYGLVLESWWMEPQKQ